MAEDGPVRPLPPLPEDWCMIHNRSEPVRPGDYRICGECWHVFRTAEELVAETHRAELDSWKFWRSAAAVQQPAERERWLATALPERRDPEKIFACPHCTHDF